MDFKVNVLSDYEHEVEITLAYDEILPEIENAYQEERKTITHPGFRKGKVPISMIKKMYGEAIEYKASEKIANKKFWDVVDEKELKPISTPELSHLNFVKDEKLECKVKYEVKPEIELKDYKGLEIEKPVFKVKDEDIDKEVNYLLKQYATFEDDTVISSENYRITVDLQKLDENQEPVEGQKSTDIVIDLGDEKVNPQIRQNAVDKKIGDTFSFEFVDEHMHGEEKHTETYRYSAEVKKIEKFVLPEADEEFIKKVSKNKAASLDEFKNQMKESFEKYYEQQSDSVYMNGLLDKVVSNNDFAAPPGYVNMLADRMADAEIENAKRRNQPAPEKSMILKAIQERAEWNAKWQIIMEKLAEAEGIKVEDADLGKLAAEEAEKTGIAVEKLINFYKESKRSETLLEEKVIEFLKENNKAKEVDPEKKPKASKKKPKKAKEQKEKSDEN